MSDERLPGQDATAGTPPPPAPAAQPDRTQEPGETGEAGEPEAQVTEELRARVEELEDLWRRALADLDNLRKRTARDIARQQAEERARVAAEWLPVVDNLDLALEHSTADAGAIVEGVRAVRDQAVALLARLGFPRQEDVGAPFDPTRHEAVGVVPAPEVPESTVVRVVRPGYGDDERQLRPAAVLVASKGG
jgi:molecular chaperone GrpE